MRATFSGNKAAPPMHLTFWQPIPSFHQEAFLNALASAEWVESVNLCYEQEMPERRFVCGWPRPIFRGVEARAIRPGEVPVDEPGRVHFFTGFYTHPDLWRVFEHLPEKRQSACYALTEAPALYGWRKLPRLMKYRRCAQRLDGRLDGLLAIGGKAEVFYRSLLPANTPVYPFAYYDSTIQDFPSIDASTPCEQFQLLYVGRLVHLKGLDRLFKALAILSSETPRWQLTLLGDGPEEESLIRLAQNLGISERLIWKSSVSADKVSAFYQNADLLIQPSRGDGWGVTVIEALRHGCEVIATKACGAASVIHPSKRLDANWKAWVPILEKQLKAGPLSSEHRQSNQKRAAAYSVEAGVAALKNILEEKSRIAASFEEDPKSVE